MLKFGGSRPESDGNEAKDRDRKQRHQRTAQAVMAAGGASANVPANVAMEPGRGGDSTPKGVLVGNQQMAPPDIPYGTGQSPAQQMSRRGSKELGTPNSTRHVRK